MASALLEAHSLSAVTPDGILLFDHLDLVLERRILGLVGRNGSGKSTLGRILAGSQEPHAGFVLRHASIGWLPQEVRPDPGARVVDLLGVAREWDALRRLQSGGFTPMDVEAIGESWDLEARLQSWLSGFGLNHVTLDAEANECSGGELTRLGLIALLMGEPELLILDEPSNHLDAVGRRHLVQFLEEWPGGILVITHDRGILEHTERILELSSLGLESYPGPWAAYQALKAQARAAAGHNYEVVRAERREQKQRRQTALERQQRRQSRARNDRREANQAKILLDFMEQESEATAARLVRQHAARIAVSEAREREARKALEVMTPIALTIPSANTGSGKKVLSVEELSMGFGERMLYEDLSFDLFGSERLILRGANGCGKSVLLKLVCGILRPMSGQIRVCASAKMLDQHQSLLDNGTSALENFRRLAPGLREADYRTRLARLGMKGEEVLRCISVMSGGERLKVALAGVLLGPEAPELLLLDEPTNHLDLASVTALEAALSDYKGALIAVSHDTHFLENVGFTRAIQLDQHAPKKSRDRKVPE